MIDFYFNGGPNPMKVALLLEELELPYRPIPVDMLKGQQHKRGLLSPINPNGKVPAIVDNGVTRVRFERTSCSTSPRRQASSCPPTRRRGAVASCPG